MFISICPCVNWSVPSASSNREWLGLWVSFIMFWAFLRQRELCSSSSVNRRLIDDPLECFPLSHCNIRILERHGKTTSSLCVMLSSWVFSGSTVSAGPFTAAQRCSCARKGFLRCGLPGSVSLPHCPHSPHWSSMVGSLFSFSCSLWWVDESLDCCWPSSLLADSFSCLWVFVEFGSWGHFSLNFLRYFLRHRQLYFSNNGEIGKFVACALTTRLPAHL